MASQGYADYKTTSPQDNEWGFARLCRQRTTDNGQRRGFASATPDKGQRRAALRLRQTTRLLVNKTMSGGFAEDMPDNYVDL